MKVLHWIVLVTSLATAAIISVPLYIMKKVLIHALTAAVTASEKCLSNKLTFPSEKI